MPWLTSDNGITNSAAGTLVRKHESDLLLMVMCRDLFTFVNGHFVQGFYFTSSFSLAVFAVFNASTLFPFVTMAMVLDLF